MKLLLLAVIFSPVLCLARSEVMVYKYGSKGERISWSIGESRNDSRREVVESLRQFKHDHPNKTLIVYKRAKHDLQPWFVDNLKFLRIDYEVVEVTKQKTKKIARELHPMFSGTTEVSEAKSKDFVKNAKNWFNSVYEAPTKTEISHGYVMGGLKGSLAAPFWYASGVSMEVATILTIGVALNELLQTQYMRTLDNIYLARKNTDPDFTINRSFWANLALRSAVSLSFAYLWRSISGPVGAAHSVRSLQGNMELWTNALAKLPGAWFGSVKATRLSRTASSWMGFVTFGIWASLLNNADITGQKLQGLVHIPPIKYGDLIILEPSTTLVILFGSILTAGVIVKYGPAHKISRAFESLDHLTKRVILKTTLTYDKIAGSIFSNRPGATTRSCNLVFN